MVAIAFSWYNGAKYKRRPMAEYQSVHRSGQHSEVNTMPVSPDHTTIPSKPGIYAIWNLVNGKVYIGQAANLKKRQSQHLDALRHNRHGNTHLQRAFDLYGEAAFSFMVVETYDHVDKEALAIAEQSFCDGFIAAGVELYNVRTCVESNLGIVCSDLTRQRLRDAWRTRPPTTEETRRRLSETLSGKQKSEEHRHNIKAAKAGKPVSEATHRAFLAKRTGVPNAKLFGEFDFVSPDGQRVHVIGLNEFCREHGLIAGKMSDVTNGKRKHHKGWTRYNRNDLLEEKG